MKIRQIISSINLVSKKKREKKMQQYALYIFIYIYMCVYAYGGQIMHACMNISIFLR